MTIEEAGVLKLTSAAAVAARCQGLFESLADGRSLADELVAERHKAAAG